MANTTPPTTKSLRSVLFGLALLFQNLPLCHAQGGDQNVTSTQASTPTSTNDTDTTDFTSAVLVAASVAPEIAHFDAFANGSNPIPLPTGIPNYYQLSQLAALYPPLQEITGQPDVADIIADITPPGNASTAMDRRQSSMRVLVVGDSITHCNNGDFTWRYRISQWFSSQGIAVDFVGPYVGTQDPDRAAPPQPPALYNSPASPGPLKVNGGYAAEFDSNHFAISGRAAAVVQGLIQDVTANYPADLMLVLLGFNDLGFFYSDDDGLLRNMNALVTNARRSNPNMKFVLGNVVHRTWIPGRQDLVENTDSYNGMLREQAPRWSTSSSPVVVAPVREEFDCGPQYSTDCPAAYDGLHPGDKGDYQIARAFSRALVHGLGIGNAPLVVPSGNVERQLGPVEGLQMASSPLGVTATWSEVKGAYGYDVEYNINDGAPFKFSPGGSGSTRWDSRWAADGWKYDIRVRASAGNTRKGPWTGWVTAIARPQTPPAPNNLTLTSTSAGIDLRWTPPTGQYSEGIILYNIYYWDLDTACAFLLGAAFEGTSARLEGLNSGHEYLVAIETWSAVGAGFPLIAPNIIVGGGTPAAPQNLRIVAMDETSVHLEWNPSSGATGYWIWLRNVNEAGSRLKKLENPVRGQSCAQYFFLFPGTWNYEWAISAYNGDAESPLGTPVLAPRPSGSSSPVCPQPPTKVGCPAGSGGAPPGTTPVDNTDPRPPPQASSSPIPTVQPTPDIPPPQSSNNPRPTALPSETAFEYAAIGDSYASGVSYTFRTHYDDNRVCLRINHAYSLQILADFPDLGSAGNDGDLSWPACSGSTMIDMVRGGDPDKKEQVAKINSDKKRLITMQVGGNDAGFFGVAVDCFFHLELQDSKGKYPDPNSACARALGRVRGFVGAPFNSGGGMNFNIKNTILDLFNQPNAQNIEQLYVLGYPRFFNAATDWCDTYSMTVGFPGVPEYDNTLLVKPLRRELNEMTDLFNNAIKDAVDSFGPDSRVKFIDISPAFEGHRFCEEGTGWFREHNFGGNGPWIWSLTPADIVSGSGGQAIIDDFMNAYSPGSDPNGRESAQAKFNWTDTLNFAKGSEAQDFHINSNGLGPGVAYRPFHPTGPGHTAIKDLIVARMRTDFFNKPKPNTAPPPTETPPTNNNTQLCIASVSSGYDPASASFISHHYAIVSPDDPCNQLDRLTRIRDNVEDSVCDIPNRANGAEPEVSLCRGGDALFVNEGNRLPEDDCSIAIRQGNFLFSDIEYIGGSADGNPCICNVEGGDELIVGEVLFKGLPTC